MDINILIIIIGFLGTLVSRISLIEFRSSIPMRAGLFSTIVSFISTMLVYSMIVLAFLLYTWWIVILSLLGLVLTAGFIVSARNLSFFFSIKLVLDFIILILASYAWLSYLS